MSDRHAQLKQLREHAHALRVDLSAIRAAGGDRQVIDMARRELYWVWRLAIEAMEKKHG